MDAFLRLYVPMAPMFPKPNGVDLCKRDIQLVTISDSAEPPIAAPDAPPSGNNVQVDPDAMDVS